MAEGNKKLPAGVTPGKLALIGVLAVILVVVLVVQFGGLGGGGSSPAAPAADIAAGTPAPPKPETNAAPESAGAPGPLERQPPWPIITAVEARKHNPFAVSAAMSPWFGPAPVDVDEAAASLDEAQQRQAARYQEVLHMLRTYGVSIIIDDGTGPAAVIGDRTYRIGDVIEGFRVIDINPQDGVLLEVAPQAK